MVGNEGKKAYRFVTVDCRKMHLRAPEHLKMSLKKLSLTADIFGKSHDVVLKLHQNWKQTYFLWSLVVPA